MICKTFTLSSSLVFLVSSSHLQVRTWFLDLEPVGDKGVAFQSVSSPCGPIKHVLNMFYTVKTLIMEMWIMMCSFHHSLKQHL